VRGKDGKNSAWARLIQRVYEVGPLECPRCGAPMRLIAVINDPAVIRKILEHLGLRLANARPVPRAHSPPAGPRDPSDPSFSHLPSPYENEINQLPPAHPTSCALSLSTYNSAPRYSFPVPKNFLSARIARSNCA
jgi:hypothetical protein